MPTARSQNRRRYNQAMRLTFKYRTRLLGCSLLLAALLPHATQAQTAPGSSDAGTARNAESIESVPATPTATEAAPSATDSAAPATETDLWQRVRRGFAMADMDSPSVQSQELWYANRPDYIKRFVERGSRYLFHIVEEVERRGMPTEVVLLPIIESAFNPQAYSRAHASGMWQFIPSTGTIFGLKQDWLTDNRRDVLLSTNAALDYLQKLHGMFNSWELAFAAYNCGEGCVGRAIAANERKGLPTDFLSLRLPNETRAYVPKLLAVKNIILSPASYGIDLPAVENRPYFTLVPAPEKIDVSLAAKLAEMEPDAFAQLNPSFNKPVAATGTGVFLVPIEKADLFKLNLELYRSLNGPMVSWTTVSAKRGESVDAVARRHGMTASFLRATNGPLKERKGKFTQPVTFMAPNSKDANAIRAAFDQKVALRREQVYGAVNDGDDGPLIKGPMQSGNLKNAGLIRELVIEPKRQPETTPDVTAAVAIVSTTNPATANVATVANVEWTMYRVVKGDTLFNIAKRAGLALNDFKAANQLTTNTVNLGQSLRVPTSAAANFVVAENVATNAVSATSGSQPIRATAAITMYTVRAGDTFYAIAKKFQITVDALLARNRMTTKTVLQPGTRLRITG
jgi:membrane-bound lytic murein transglycosylase D